MWRREFIGLLGGAALAWPLAARAQRREKIPRIGVLWHAGSAKEEDIYLSVLRKAFSGLGYVEGKNIEFEHRFPAEQRDRFQAFAGELVESKVDALIAVTTQGAIEAKRLTTTIPIVFVIVADPVGGGLVDSLARPGGNATGLSIMTIDLTGKRLALLKEAVPNLVRVALLVDPGDPFTQSYISASKTAAGALGLLLSPVEAPRPDAIEPAFSAIAQGGADGVIVGPGPMLFNERGHIGSSALAHKVPTLVNVAEMVPDGALLSYGPDFPDFFRRAAVFVDKILKGAKPADLPVEQPTEFKLVVNLKTAKALGLDVPFHLQQLADEVIE